MSAAPPWMGVFIAFLIAISSMALLLYFWFVGKSIKYLFR